MAGLWELIDGTPQVDPGRLAAAVEQAAARGGLDFRTRLLIRDATAALHRHWGERLQEWLARSPSRQAIESICREDLGEPGFPRLEGALVEQTDPEKVRQYLRELGTAIHTPTRLVIGGAIALILPGRLARRTDDIHVVDEVPEKLRRRHALLDDLARRYGLRLTHFQSHFLPAGWQERTHSLAPFGNL